VYIATGKDFPDALGAGPAAAKDGGPLLLTDTNTLPTVVRDELTRLRPGRIVVVGSPSVVSYSVATSLAYYLP
jgi:putative cell wall-binding protein